MELVPFALFYFVPVIFGHLNGLVTNQDCSYDADCKENSFCFDNTERRKGKCMCKQDYITDKTKTYYECLEIPKGPNEFCKKDVQCQFIMGTHSTCEQEKCRCKNGSHLAKDNKCYQTINLGDVCQVDNNCLLENGNYGFCTRGRCRCDIGYQPTIDKRSCIRRIPLGRSCPNSDADCPDLSECMGVCKCIAGYVESEDNIECLKAADIFGANCTENPQCSEYLKGSSCIAGRCLCPDGFHGYGNECSKDARLHEPCTTDKECKLSAELDNVVRCIEGTCQCIVGVSSEDQYGCIIPGASTKTFFGCVMSFIIVAPLLFI